MGASVMYEVARCKHGIIGIITNKKGDVYFGFTLRGKPWQSIGPEILASSIYEYITDNASADGFIEEVEDGSPDRRRKKSVK